MPAVNSSFAPRNFGETVSYKQRPRPVKARKCLVCAQHAPHGGAAFANLFAMPPDTYEAGCV
jgi:hypothetical protein